MICMVKLKQICLDYPYLISLLTFQFFTAVYIRTFKKVSRLYNFIYFKTKTNYMFGDFIKRLPLFSW